MSELSLGIIETVGLAAAFEAADVCVKSANVTLIGYELANGNGMATVKIQGNVGAVKAAIEAAKISAEKVNKVVSASVIPRPNRDIDFLIENKNTVGLENQNKDFEQKQKAGELSEPDGVKDEDEMIFSVFSEEEQSVNADEEKLSSEQDGKNNSDSNLDTDENVKQADKKDENIVKKNTISEKSKEKIENENSISNEKITCNLCKDPKCPRKKGELRSLCIHYKNK